MIEFFKALFSPDDLIVVKPIESWIEEGHKKSKTDFKSIRYCKVADIEKEIEQQKALSESSKCSIYIGVCPRAGDGGRFELASQIRKLKCLWADIDNCTVDEALQRCKDAGLPEPSIVIASGNGVHLYWILMEPIEIDDALQLPVETEWTEERKPIKFVVDPIKGKLYLKDHPELKEVCPQVLRLQSILDGIAERIGGDSTSDPSRLLRVPTTWNRKNQRNGDEPKPCVIVKCDPLDWHSIEDFEKFAKAKSRNVVSESEEPDGRLIEDLSPSELKRWNGMLAKAEFAEVGSRSESDFALLMLAHELQLDRDEVNGACCFGKFDERSHTDYFAKSWERAKLEWNAKKPNTELTEDKFKIESVGDLIKDYPSDDPIVIAGLVREAETMLLIASTKSKKTWLVLGLAYSIAAGLDWLGRPTTQGKVLVVDCELKKSNLRFRCQRIAKALGVDPSIVDVVCLRGKRLSINEIYNEITSRVQHGHYRLIVLDPLYKLLPRGTSENSNEQMSDVMSAIEALAERTGSTVAVVHHQSKGDQSGKAITDLGSGAGSLNRSADCLVTMRPHKNDGQVVAEFLCRSMPEEGCKPTTLKWTFPLWQPTADAPLVRQQSNSLDRKRANDATEANCEILTILGKAGKPVQQERLLNELSFGRNRATTSLNRMVKDGLILRRVRRKKGSSRKSVFWEIEPSKSHCPSGSPSATPSGS